MAKRLRVHGHEERTVWRFTFDFHEGNLGQVGFQPIPSTGLFMIQLSILLPFLVLMLNELKVVFYQIYLFG